MGCGASKRPYHADTTSGDARPKTSGGQQTLPRERQLVATCSGAEAASAQQTRSAAAPTDPVPPSSTSSVPLNELVAPPSAETLAELEQLTKDEPPPAYGISPHDPCASLQSEQDRLAALHALNVAKQPGGPRFSAITSLIKNLFGVPIANVILFDEHVALPVPEGGTDEEWAVYPRCTSACKWLVGENAMHEMLIAEDLSQDARFQNTKYVSGPPHVRFYASTPLVSSDRGLRYGTLCVLDFAPRTFGADQYQMLPHLAEVVVREIEGSSLVRFRQLALEEARTGVQRLVRGLDCFSEGILVCDTEAEAGWRVEYANQAAANVTSLPQSSLQGGSFWRLFRVAPGSDVSLEQAQQAVKQGRSCRLRCVLRGSRDGPAADTLMPRTPGGGADAATPAQQAGPGSVQGSVACEPRRHASVTFARAGSSELESVLSGRARLETLLRPAASGPLSAVPEEAANVVDVVLTPANSPGFRPDEPPVAIPPTLAAWFPDAPSGGSQAGTTSNASSSSAAGAPRQHSAPSEIVPSTAGETLGDVRAGGSSGGAHAGAAQLDTRRGGFPVAPVPTRLWFATITRPGSEQQGAPLIAAERSLSTSSIAVSAEPTAPGRLDYLQPRELASVRLGPLLGAGASGRTYRGLWYGSVVAVKIIDIWHDPAPVADAKGTLPGEPGGSGRGGNAFSGPHLRKLSSFGHGSTGGNGGGGGGLQRSSMSQEGGANAAAVLEALFSRALSHPHIVPTHAWGVSDCGEDARGRHHQQVWIVQSLCSRGTLGNAIDVGRFKAPGADAPNLVHILQTAVEVAGALAFLHSVDVVHGDLTPNNILLSSVYDQASGSKGTTRGFKAMVADFGLSRPTTSPLSSVPRCTFGTVTHMAPELMTDDELAPASDSFSFGVILWELLSGRRAWRGMGPLQVIHAVTVEKRMLAIPEQWPQGLQELIRRCLSSDPAQRPTAAEILSATQALLAEEVPGLAGDSGHAQLSYQSLPGVSTA